MIEIEKGIPIPNIQQRRRVYYEYLHALKNMELGDSFLAPTKKVAMSIYQFSKRNVNRIDFSVKIRQEGDVFRVWKVTKIYRPHIK